MVTLSRRQQVLGSIGIVVAVGSGTSGCTPQQIWAATHPRAFCGWVEVRDNPSHIVIDTPWLSWSDPGFRAHWSSHLEYHC